MIEVQKKIFLIVFIPIFFMCIIIFLIFTETNTLNSKFQLILNNSVPSLILSSDIKSKINYIQYLSNKLEEQKNKHDIKSKDINEIKNEIIELNLLLDLYKKYELSEVALTLRNNLDTEMDKFNSIYKEFIGNILENKNRNNYDIFINKTEEIKNILQNIDINNENNLEKYKENPLQKVLMIILIGTLASIFLSLLFSLLYSKKLVTKLSNIINSLFIVENSVRENSVNLKKLNESSKILTEKQFESTKNSVNVLNDIAKASAESFHEVKDLLSLSKEIQEVIKIGESNMGNMSSSIENLFQSSTKLLEIEKIINEIDEKTTVISDIVTKTELLSLNASIEAARAGEFGKGFSVVAEEVGHLAKMSGESSNTIKQLIEKSKNQVQHILLEIKNKILESKNQTKELENSFSQISKNVENSLNKINSIGETIEKQANDSKNNANALNELESISNDTLKNINESSNCSNSMKIKADELSNAIFNFKKVIYGNAS